MSVGGREAVRADDEVVPSSDTLRVAYCNVVEWMKAGRTGIPGKVAVQLVLRWGGQLILSKTSFGKSDW